MMKQKNQRNMMKKSMKKYNVKFSYLQSQILVIDSVLAGKEMSLAPNKGELLWEKLLHSWFLLYYTVL